MVPPDCQILRKRVRRAANFLSRNPFASRARDEYISASRRYRKFIKKAKRTYRENTMQKLVNSIDKQELWSVLSELRGKKSGAPIAMSDLESHFDKLLNNAPKIIPEGKINELKTKLLEFLNVSQCDNSDINTGGYNCEFLNKVVKSLKNGKSAFLDGATNEVLKHSLPQISDVFVKFFNHIESAGEFPEQWKSSFLVPLHKKGPKGDRTTIGGLLLGATLVNFIQNV